MIDIAAMFVGFGSMEESCIYFFFDIMSRNAIQVSYAHHIERLNNRSIAHKRNRKHPPKFLYGEIRVILRNK